ncbi:MAG: Flagellar hook-length control protein FliK, partial [Frankiales bacterium]|nr:Flagellar hook-length control protein FliK [Frankiales bacterium]
QVRPAVGELARGLKAAGGGRASLVVRLDPPELGPVVVRLTVREGRVDVQLRTSEAVAASGLVRSAADVRSTLLAHGLDLSSFDVRQGPSAQDRPSQQQDRPAPDGAATSGRRESSDQATPQRGGRADRTASDPRTGREPGTTTETTADGAPAGAWL